MNLLKRMFYVSRATIHESSDVQRIVQVARERNASLSITGMLIFSGEHFAQCLEGPEEAVETLLRSIRADSRHIVQHEWPLVSVEARWFPLWSMGYVYDDRLEEMLTRLEDDHRLPPLDSVLGIFQDVALNKRSVAGA